MPFSDSLEVGIGLSFIFFLSSLVLASIHEAIEIIFKARGKYLFNGIVELLDDPKLMVPPQPGAIKDDATSPKPIRSGEAITKIIYQHPVIRGLMRGDINQPCFERKLPSYIPTRSFVAALLDEAAQGKLQHPESTGTAPSSATPIQQLRMLAEGIQNQQVRTALVGAIDSANQDLDALRDNIEHWFDSAMDRVSGWYKRRSQVIIFCLGLVTAVLLNVNTIIIAQSLATSSKLRDAVTATATAAEGKYVASLGPQTDAAQNGNPSADIPEGAIAELDRTNLPLGWSDAAISEITALTKAPATANGWMQSIFGWIEIGVGYLLTAFAVTLGAPFWFDILNRLMVIRATVKPTEKSPDEASQDPQAPTGNQPLVKILAPALQPALAAKPPPGFDTAIFRVEPDPAAKLFEDDTGGAISGVVLPVTP